MDKVTDTLGRIFDGAWNRAEGIFDRLIDFEFLQKENDLAFDYWVMAREQDARMGAGQPQWSPPSPAAPTSNGGPDLTRMLLIGGGVVVAGLLVYRLAK